MQTCNGKTKTGAACRAPAGSGGLCYLHADPDRAKTLGRIGGQQNRRSIVDLVVPDNPSLADIGKMNIQAIRLLLAGELGAREASAFVQLSNSLHRIIPAVALEARVTMLEEQIAQHESGTSPQGDSTSSSTEAIATAGTEVSDEADEGTRDSTDAVEHEEEAESRTSPQSDAAGASTEAVVTAETEVSDEADEGTPSSTDATLEQEAEAESTIDGYNEAEEA